MDVRRWDAVAGEDMRMSWTRLVGRGALAWLALAALALGAVGCGRWLWDGGGSAGGSAGRGGGAVSVGEALGGVGDGYAAVVGGREFAFPGDHGPHADYGVEWWHFVGNLDAVGLDGDGGRRFGYQLTFFRVGVGGSRGRADVGAGGAGDGGRGSAWAADDVYMGHFAVTDAGGGGHYWFERVSRGALGLAGASGDPFGVWVEGWSARGVGVGDGDGGAGADVVGDGGDGVGVAGVDGGLAAGADGGLSARLRAVGDGGLVGVDLRLDSVKGAVLHGDGGFSAKGGDGGNASYYYSLPRMGTVGTVMVGGAVYDVRGMSWLDREWSSSILSDGYVGWDWFGLRFSDGRDLVYFRLRPRDGDGGDGAGGFVYGAIVGVDGGVDVLDDGDVVVEELGRWRSPHGGEYPSGWRVVVLSAGLDVRVSPYVAGQELDGVVRYWEGAVGVEGAAGGEVVSGDGYVELTGY